ncbi:MAG: hypothetical protein WCF85_22090, partial [Rhodospirillaceae bacterium]
MPLKNLHPARWPWETAIAWIAFDLIDELNFWPRHPDYPARVGLTRQQVDTRCAAAAEELAAAIADGRLVPRWRAAEHPKTTRGGRDDTNRKKSSCNSPIPRSN